MATLRQIKEQQNSVSTINKITKAMKLVSSAKSQKAIKEMRKYRDYFKKIEEIISDLIDDKKKKEFFKGVYWILIMSDLGLAGGYNHNIIKKINTSLKKEDKLLIIGNKGLSFFKKNKKISELFTLGNLLEGNKLSELTTRIKTEFYDRNMKVNILYTKFESQIEFSPEIKTILPIQKKELNNKEVIKKPKPIVEYEPEKEFLLKELESLYIHSFIVSIYKESQSSEHTSRKNAMENASMNGEELLEKLNIEYNRGRQAKITQEISEIIGGAESLK
ncbi:MAG: ATP synthase F1 subunit gamma [Mycoplasmataceae bacterium]|nr:ATP synthase F1 subunit gamma [Mycoplasmataceae bacterium]